MKSQLNLKKHRKFRCCNCFDIVQDKVVNRLVYVFVGLIVFFVLVYSVSSITQPGPNQVSTIQFGIPPPIITSYQKKLELTRTARAFARNKEGSAVHDTKVSIELVNIITPIVTNRLRCNSSRLRQLQGTLEIIRLANVCQPKFYNSNISTDSDGEVAFKDFYVQYGPQGNYNFKYKSSSVQSPIFSISLQSQVAQLTTQANPPIVIKVNQAFPQFSVQVKDQNGSPVQGIRVKAFSWIDSNFEEDKTDPIFVLANKFGLLSGDISEPSDANGMAKFTSLKVEGFTFSFVHLMFAVNAKVVLSWTDIRFESINETPLPPALRPPIFVQTQVQTVTLLTQPSQSVTEGQIWPVQPKVKVTNSAGQPLADKIVFVHTLGLSSKNYPLLYKNKIGNQTIKKLLNTIPGTFNSFDQYLNGSEIIQIGKTDTNGQVQFTQLKWNTEGRAGTGADNKYTLVFGCDGKFASVLFQQQVLSSIANVQFQSTLPSQLIMDPQQQYDHIVVIRVTNAQKIGVKGKFPHQLVINQVGGSAGDVVINIQNEIGQFSASSNDGFMSIPIKIVQLKTAQSTVTLTFKIDDKTLVTNQIVVRQPNSTISKVCTFIQTITPPPSTTPNNSPFNMSFKGVLANGSPWVGGKVALQVIFNAQYPNKINSDIINSYETALARATTDSVTGVANFNSFQFKNQPFGQYFIRIAGTNTLSEQKCYSKIFQIFVQTDIQKIEIVSPKNTNFAQFDQVVNQEAVTTTKLRVYNYDGNPIANTNLGDVTLDFIHIPPTLFNQFFFSIDNFFTLTTTTATTDSLGQVDITWKVNRGNPGAWGIQFKIQGVGTQVPFTFTTDFPVGSVTIQTQPANSGTVYLGDNATTPPVIRVLDTSGAALQGYMVTSFMFSVDANTGNLDTSTSKIEGLMDPYTSSFYNLLDSQNDQNALLRMSSEFITFAGNKNARTDSSGDATITNFTVLDHSGVTQGCFKFVFLVGDPVPNRFKRSALSDMVCFTSDESFSISNTPSTKVSPNQNFQTPPTLRITKSRASQQDQSGMMMLVATVSKFNLIDTSSQFFNQQNYFTGNFCGIFNQQAKIGGCSNPTIISDGLSGRQFIMQTPFTNLKFTFDQNIDFESRYSTPLRTAVNFAQLGKRTVENQAQVVNIISQPPSTIQILRPFQVKVLATLNNGSPVANVEVFVNVTATSSVSSSSGLTSQVLNFAATGQISLQNLSSLSSDTNIRLDPQSVSAFTNSAGIATFTPTIISGTNGSYQLKFASGSGQSPNSSPFTLTNKVSSIIRANEISGSYQSAQTSVTISSTTFSQYQATLDPQPIIQIKDSNNAHISGLSSQISVFVISYTDLANAYSNLGYDINDTSQTVSINSVLSNIQTASSSFDNAVTQVTSAWTILTQGASNIGKSSNKHVSEFASFSAPTQTASGQYQFTDLQIKVRNTGTYVLIFSCLGVQSTRSQTFQIKKQGQNTTLTQIIALIILILFLLAILIPVLASNSYYVFGNKCNIILGVFALILVSLYAWFTAFSSHSVTLKVMLITVCVLTIISIVYMFIQLSCKSCQKFIFYQERDIVFKEYTYQRLFLKPSSQWAAKFKPKSKRQIVSENDQIHVVKDYSINQFSHINQDVQGIELAKQQDDNSIDMKQHQNGNGFQFDQNNQQQNVQPNYAKLQKKAFNSLKINQAKLKKTSPFFSRSVIKNFFQLFVPFQFRAHKLHLGDCFYYPQRFILSMVMGFFAFCFIAYNIIIFLLNLNTSIVNLKRNIIFTVYGFIRSSVTNLYGWLKLDAQNANITPFIDQVNTLASFLNQVSLALTVGFSISTAIASMIILLACASLLYDFKRCVLDARLGIWNYPRRRFNIVNATQFPGNVLSTYTLGYIIIIFMFSVVLVPISIQVTWRILWHYRLRLIAILAPALVNAIIKVILKKVMVRQNSIIFRRGFAIFEIFMLYLGITAGIVSGLLRFLMMLLVGLISLAKLDIPIIPLWILRRIMWLDFPNGSYFAVVLIHHSHNNPIANTFKHILLEGLQGTKMPDGGQNSIKIVEQSEIQHLNKLKRIARRFRVCLLLNKNKQLIQYRKHNLIPKKQKNKRGKNNKKQNKITDSPDLSEEIIVKDRSDADIFQDRQNKD